jgi:hypothetical protein
VSPEEIEACTKFLGKPDISFNSKNDLFMALFRQAQALKFYPSMISHGRRTRVYISSDFIGEGPEPITAMVAAVVKYMEGKNAPAP